MTRTRLKEARTLLVLALPLIFAYLADVLMVVTAKMVVGKLGYLELAASGVSADIGYQLAIVLMGFFSVVGVLVSSGLGAGRREVALPALAQGMVLATILGGALTVLVRNLDMVLALARQDPEVIAMARLFYESFAWAMLPIVWFGVLRSFVSALMRTGFVMFVTVATVIANYGLMQGLVHGSFGLPALGIAGAGLAWSISMWFKFICLGSYTLWLIAREKLEYPPRDWAAARTDLMAFVRLGLPVAGIVALESGLFAAVSLMSGTLGAKALASYQMLMAWIAIPFVISLGLAEAAMVRVAFWAGADDGSAARRSGNLALLIGIAIPLVLVSVPLAAPWLFTDIFLDPSDPGFADITTLVAQLLVIAAVFQVFDGMQAIASHALRGLRDAAMPLLIAGVGYWVVGLGSSYLFAFTLGGGVIGMWWGLALGLAFTGTLLAWRFETIARRGLVA